MNQEEIDDIARRLSKRWTDLLRSRQKNNLQIHSFLKQLEANSCVVLKYEDEALLVKKAF